jgi:hypothetical protein
MNAESSRGHAVMIVLVEQTTCNKNGNELTVVLIMIVLLVLEGPAPTIIVTVGTVKIFRVNDPNSISSI